MYDWIFCETHMTKTTYLFLPIIFVAILGVMSLFEDVFYWLEVAVNNTDEKRSLKYYAALLGVVSFIFIEIIKSKRHKP